MEEKHIHTHLHAAWALSKYGYKVRRPVRKSKKRNLFSVMQDKNNTIKMTWMTSAALINLAKQVIRSNGNLETLHGKR